MEARLRAGMFLRAVLVLCWMVLNGTGTTNWQGGRASGQRRGDEKTLFYTFVANGKVKTLDW